jgi:hypothetical protein
VNGRRVGTPPPVNIDKQQILDMLRNAGENGKADKLDLELPDQVDTDEHAGLLKTLGINPADL